MNPMMPQAAPGDDRFQTVEEFLQSLRWGGEVAFRWKGLQYGICAAVPPAEGGSPAAVKYCVAYGDGSCERWYDTPEETLEHPLGEDRLGDIITRVEVLYRNL